MVDKLRKKDKEDDMVPVNTTAKPGQLELANIDNLTIEKLSNVQLPHGQEVCNKTSFKIMNKKK